MFKEPKGKHHQVPAVEASFNSLT